MESCSTSKVPLSFVNYIKFYFIRAFRCLLGQHPRLRFNRRKRSVAMEKYKRLFIRHYKLVYDKREKRHIPNYLSNLNSELRQKRALKGGGSSRTFGTSHKSSNSQLNLRRGNKKTKNNIDDEKPTSSGKSSSSLTKSKHKNKGPCEPLSSEPFVNVEVVKYGKDPNVSFSSGTIVKMACGKGYGLNMPENKTAKCVRGKWRPTKPTCFICKYKILNCVFFWE